MSSSVASGSRLGPIEFQPGVTAGNALTKLYASFVAIACLTGMSLLQGYILTEHLHVPRSQQGTVSGNLAFWTEVVSLLCFIPFGILADRIGRRPIYVCGILMIGLGWGLFPFAVSLDQLMMYRLIYGVGSAATMGALSTMVNDYPLESSRGKFIGVTAMVNVLGTIFVARILGGIPAVMTGEGYDPVTAGRVMFLSVTALCLVTAVVAAFGLKGGTPLATRRRASPGRLITSGARALRNPRIALAYAGAFAARSDVVIKGLFMSLWAIQAGRNLGLNPGQAMARFGTVIVLMYVVSLVSAPLFGWFIDQVNRMTAMIVALVFAATGYLSMYLITSPLDFAMLPYLVILTLGSGFMTKASMALLGQEAPTGERGSVIATAQTFGAIGILVFTVVGGRLFDEWGPWAPFVVAGAYQALLLLVAILIRIMAPGTCPAAVATGRRYAVFRSGEASIP